LYTWNCRKDEQEIKEKLVGVPGWPSHWFLDFGSGHGLGSWDGAPCRLSAGRGVCLRFSLSFSLCPSPHPSLKKKGGKAGLKERHVQIEIIAQS